jgi:hypothetical protein
MKEFLMKKQYIISALLVTTPILLALTNTEAQKKGAEILQNLVNGHNRAFGQNNLLKSSPDLSVWAPAIAQMKSFVTTVINENKSYYFMKDSTLVDALNKISKAEIDLVNTIKMSRGLLNSPKQLIKPIEALTKIINDMVAVQKKLTMKDSSIAKNEAQKILKNSALFIETTAIKARNDANAAFNPAIPKDLPPVPAQR